MFLALIPLPLTCGMYQWHRRHSNGYKCCNSQNRLLHRRRPLYAGGYMKMYKTSYPFMMKQLTPFYCLVNYTFKTSSLRTATTSKAGAYGTVLHYIKALPVVALDSFDSLSQRG